MLTYFKAKNSSTQIWLNWISSMYFLNKHNLFSYLKQASFQIIPSLTLDAKDIPTAKNNTTLKDLQRLINKNEATITRRLQYGEKKHLKGEPKSWTIS